MSVKNATVVTKVQKHPKSQKRKKSLLLLVLNTTPALEII